MTERPSQSADGSGIAQADNGATATVNYATHHHYVPESPRTTRAIHLNPPPSLFIGRGPELAALHQHLAREGSVAYIPGFPGRGKSTLANFYAHQHKDEYQTVHWLPCHSKSLVEIAAEFVWQLDLKLDGDLEANLKQLRAHCARNRCLLILDNVDDEAPAGMLLGGRSSVLLTTWHTNLKFLRPVPAIPLPVFTEDQCLELFREKIGANEVDRHLDGSRLLFSRLEHHPFALDIAASLIREDRRYTIAGMAKNLPADIPALFAEAIATLSPEAQSLLAAMAACAPEGFRLSLAAEVAGFDEDAAFQALNQICSRSLADELDRDTHRYRLHALVRVASQATDKHHAQHATVLLVQFENWEANWHECEQDVADWQTAYRWLLNFQREDVWKAANRIAFLGYALTYRVGRTTEAYKVCTELVQRSSERLDLRCLQAWLGNQAVILEAWGRADEALSLMKGQEGICKELDDQACLQSSYGNQAAVLQYLGRLEEAMVLLKRKEEICKHIGNKASLQSSLGTQALILKDWGRIDEAMNFLKRQAVICCEIGDQTGLRCSYGNQALILKYWGRLDEAMALHQKEEEICQNSGDRAGIAKCYANQGLLARLKGDTKLEREKLQLALSIATELGMLREREQLQQWLDRANGLSEPEQS